MLTDSFLFLLPFTPTDVLFIGHHIMTTSAWHSCPMCLSQPYPTLSCQMRASAEHSSVLQALMGSLYIMAASVLVVQPHMLSSLWSVKTSSRTYRFTLLPQQGACCKRKVAGPFRVCTTSCHS